MKTKVFVILLVMLMFGLSASAFAQCGNNDAGICDTVIISPTCPDSGVGIVTPVDGDSIGIPIYCWSDREIRGFTLGFHYNSADLTPSSIELAGSVIPVAGHAFKQFTKDEVAQTFLLGWVDFGAGAFAIQPSVFAAGRQLLCTVYFQLNPSATTQHIDLDSLFFPPGGSFVLTGDTRDDPGAGTYLNGSISPQYIDCGGVGDDPDDGHDILLGVTDLDSPTLPTQFTLSQNWPNPFNPTTSIDFALPKSAHVKLEVINLLGQTINTLVDEDLTAGYKRIEWDGTNFNGREVASGIYFYRIATDDFTQTKKMMLLK